MLKLAGRTGTDQPIMILGLSAENVKRLTRGEPIRVSPEEMAQLGLPPVMIVIHYGDTERAILDEFGALGVNVRPLLDKPGGQDGPGRPRGSGAAGAGGVPGADPPA